MLRRLYLFTILVLSTSTLPGCTQQTPRATAPQVVATSSFTGKSEQHTSGTYRIEHDEDGLRLILADNFQTDEGPDLHVVLSPIPAHAATNENALTDGNALVIAQLASLTGPQTFDLPDHVDLASYQSVLIHCIQYTHLYGAASLRR